MATHSSVLAWRIPGTREPGGLPSIGVHRVGHDWSDLAAVLTLGFPVAQGWKNPAAMQETQKTQVRSLGQEDPLEEGMASHSSILAWRIPWMNGGAWWATVHRVAKSQIWLKWLSMHSCVCSKKIFTYFRLTLKTLKVFFYAVTRSFQFLPFKVTSIVHFELYFVCTVRQLAMFFFSPYIYLGAPAYLVRALAFPIALPWQSCQRSISVWVYFFLSFFFIYFY